MTQPILTNPQVQALGTQIAAAIASGFQNYFASTGAGQAATATATAPATGGGAGGGGGGGSGTSAGGVAVPNATPTAQSQVVDVTEGSFAGVARRSIEAIRGVINDYASEQQRFYIRAYDDLTRNFGNQFREITSQQFIQGDFSDILNEGERAAIESFRNFALQAAELSQFEGLQLEDQRRIRRDILVEFGDANINLFHSMNEEIQKTTMMFAEGLNISASESAELIAVSFAETGEASSDILTQITNQSEIVGRAVGVPMKMMAEGIKEIKLDMETFTNVTIDSAARMVASLSQLGLTINSFKNILGGFRDFDTAADKIGDLSSIFGVQMDAMEMMYLANEDEEAFLHRFREQLLDQGMDIENMSNVRQRALANQLNMSVQEMKMFMDTGINMTDQMTLTSESQEASMMNQADAMETLSESMIKVLKSVEQNQAIIQNTMGLFSAAGASDFIQSAAEVQNTITVAQTNLEGISEAINNIQAASSDTMSTIAEGMEEIFSVTIPSVDQFLGTNQHINNFIDFIQTRGPDINNTLQGMGASAGQALTDGINIHVQARSYPLFLKELENSLESDEMLAMYDNSFSSWGNHIIGSINREMSRINTALSLSPVGGEITINSGDIVESLTTISENYDNERQVNISVDIDKIKNDIIAALKSGLTDGFENANYGFNLAIDGERIATVISNLATIDGSTFQMIGGNN